MKLSRAFFIQVLIFIFIQINTKYLFSQTPETDSIINSIKNAKEDTLKVNSLLLLSKKLNNLGELDASLQYAKKARDLSIKLNFIKGEAKAYNRIGNVCRDYGDIPAAIKNHLASLQLRQKINDKPGLIVIYNDLGNDFFTQGDYLKALENYFTSLKISEEVKDIKGQGSAYNNLSNVYYDLGNYEEALRNITEALKISKKLNDNRGIAAAYNNLGNIYYAKGDYEESINNHKAALDIRLEIDDTQNLAKSYGNLAIGYDKLGNYEEALKNNFAALEMHTATGNEQGIATVYSNLAVAYFNLKKYKEAEDYGVKALALSKTIDDLKGVKDANDALYRVYLAIKKPEKAFVSYSEYIEARDSLLNEENTKKTVRLEMNYIFQKKEAADSLREADEKKIVAIQLQQEKTQRFALYGGLALVLVFAAFMMHRFMVSQKQKKIIEAQKMEVEHQKELVVEKQKEVMDSILYAQRIQRALLASDGLLKQNLPDHFIVYEPKDIVSGDFYWATRNHNKFYLATADSTGHGVPGAFMSLLNISFLNEAITEKGIKRPNEVLDYTRTRLINALRADGSEEGGKDGMDCNLIVFDFAQNTLEYAAANNGFFIIRNNEFITCAADKMPVGRSPKDTEAFSLNVVHLQKGDILYTMTDGLQDQFGGPKGKKFKGKQIQQLLLENCNKPFEEQKVIIQSAFKNWKGKLEQVDDVCVIGVKI